MEEKLNTLLSYQSLFKTSNVDPGTSILSPRREVLREKCPNTELFLVRIQFKYRKIWTRNNSVFGHFSHQNSLNSDFIINDKRVVEQKNVTFDTQMLS